MSKGNQLSNQEKTQTQKNNASQNKRVYVQLGEKIKELRKENAFSQSQLAKKLNMSSQYIGFLERGQRGGSDEFLLELEKVLGVTPKTLISLRNNHLQDTDQQSEKPVETVHLVKNSVNNNIPHKKSSGKNPSSHDLINKGPSPTFNNEYPDYINDLANQLLACQEEYARQKIEQFIKDLQNDYLNQLPSFEIKDLKDYMLTIKSKWMRTVTTDEISTKDFTQGSIDLQDQKEYFEIEHNELALHLVLQTNNQELCSSVQELLGPTSVSYVTKSTMPHMQTEDLAGTLWFNPWVPLHEMYTYLVKSNVNISTLNIHDSRLQWYFNEQTDNQLKIAQ